MLELKGSTLLKLAVMVSLRRCQLQNLEKELNIKKEKLSKISKIRDKTTSQKKIRKLKSLFTLPARFKRLEIKENKKMI